MQAEQEAELRAFYRDLLRPPPQMSVAQWVEENVTIPAGRESFSGMVNFDRAPYAREPLECYADRSVTELVLVFGTQCLKTTILRCGAMYRIKNDPLPCMWVLPNEKNVALPFSKGRWIPLLLACPAIADMIPMTANGKPDRYHFGFLEQTFSNGMPLNFVGSNSAANLASRPIGLLQMDEIDKYGQETDFEPGALKNAEERAKNFAFPLIVKASTPTTATHGIWPEFLLTDQRHFHVPCPRCERLIVLKFRVKSKDHGDCGLRWWVECADEVKRGREWDLTAVAQAAHYKCQECGGRIGTGERTEMIQSNLAKWIAHNLAAKAGRRGYHLSSLYSLVSKDCTFPAIATAWCETSGVVSAKHRIINSTFAEPWNASKAFEDEPLTITSYDPTVIVLGESESEVTIMTIDFQLNHFWTVVRRWIKPSPEFPHGQSFLLLADRVDTEEELAALQEKYAVKGAHVRLDVAGRKNSAGQIIIRRKWRGLEGSDRKHYPHTMSNGLRIQRVYSEVQWRDAHHGTARQSRDITNFFPFVYWCKDPVRDFVAALRVHEPTIWHVHANAHPAYQQHLNAHVKLKKVKPGSGEEIEFWHEFPGRPDHLWDCECMNAETAVELGFAQLFDRAREGELFGP